MTVSKSPLPVQPLVLVVDDEARDRELLREVLEKDGFRVEEAVDGLQAMDRVHELSPDVVLLDVMLPGLNGVDVCRKLTANPRTVAIPVLLVTSQQGREDRLEGISAGARDFISKPVDIADLRVRVRNAAQMKRLYDQSEERYRRIAELEGLRDSLVHMVIHDLKSPLTVIQGNLGLLEMIVGDDLDADGKEALEACAQGSNQMKQMVNSLLDVSKLESGTFALDRSEIGLRDTVRRARASLGKDVGARIRIVGGEDLMGAIAVCDAELVQRVVVNLLRNALEHSPADERVEVRVTQGEDSVQVRVLDRGPGVPEEYRDRIFDKFVQVDGTRRVRKGSSGLGLAFCKLAVEAHGGRIGVDPGSEEGSEFWFEIPVGVPLEGSD
jgi:signal transduction histidine kinase